MSDTALPFAATSYLDHDGQRLAYRHLPGRGPGIFFLHGFRSDMTGTKAETLADLASTAGLACTRFDYTGHGQSSGTLRDGNLGRWLGDVLAVFDQLTVGPQVVVGSSLGGWLALLLAQARPERVQALVGIAAAPDFTEDLIWPALTPAQQAEVLEAGETLVPSDFGPPTYPLTRSLFESGRQHRLLNGPLAITCPVRLLQGMQDSDVPWQRALRLAEGLAGSDVRVTLVKNGDHRLSRAGDLALLAETVRELAVS